MPTSQHGSKQVNPKRTCRTEAQLLIKTLTSPESTSGAFIYSWSTQTHKTPAAATTEDVVMITTSECCHGDDSMSDWHCSVDELAVCHRQQKECERAQEALSRVTSCFQQLVTSLGSSADSNFLREEMDQARGVAHQLCMGLSQRLVRLLAECHFASSSVEDRQMLERLWVLCLSAFESFLSDLRTACFLIGRFPLTQSKDRSSLINTGCTDGMVGVAAVQVPWHTVELSSGWDFTSHITALEAMLAEMQLRVPVPFWAVQATQPAWAEAGSDHQDPDDTLEDLMEVVSNKPPPWFQPPCCGLG